MSCVHATPAQSQSQRWKVVLASAASAASVTAVSERVNEQLIQKQQRKMSGDEMTSVVCACHSKQRHRQTLIEGEIEPQPHSPSPQLFVPLDQLEGSGEDALVAQTRSTTLTSLEQILP